MGVRAGYVLSVAVAVALVAMVGVARADLVGVAAGQGSVDDATAERVLVATDDGRLQIQNVATRAITDVPLPAGQHAEGAGRLIGGGALFVSSPTDVTAAQLNEWHSGRLTSLGHINSASDIAIAGDYAIWSDWSSLYELTISSGVTVLVSTTAGNTNNDVASNGDVAYWAEGVYTIHRWRSGVDSLIAQASPLWATYPLTDGTTVLYRQTTPCCVNEAGRVAFSDGMTETVLEGSYRLRWPDRGRDYALNQGWIAYTRAPTSVYATEVWVRSPSGTLSRVSPAGPDSCTHPRPGTADCGPVAVIFGVNPSGQVLYGLNSNTLSLALGAPSVPSFQFYPEGYVRSVFWESGHWYLVVDTTISESLAGRTWKLVRLETDTAIVTRPAPVTSAPNATFTFASSAQSASYVCGLDGAVAAACSSPLSYTGLAEGTHTLSIGSTETVTGEDDPTPATATWTVDTTPPSAPDLNSPNGIAVAASHPTFSWAAASDAVSGVAAYDVWVDGALTVMRSATATSFTSTAALADGTHTWSVVARDRAGNETRSATATFVVDTAAPSAPTLGDPADHAITASARPALSWSASTDVGSGLSGYSVSIDGATVANLDAGTTSFTPTSDLGDGGHSWSVTARDAARNQTTSSERELLVDTTAPAPFTLSSPLEGAVSGSATPTFTWSTSSDGGSGLAGYTVSIDGTTTSLADASSFTPINDLADGTHLWRVTARDNAGNTRSTPTRSFVIDTHPPTPTLTVNPSPAMTGTPVTFTAGTATASMYAIVDHAWDLNGDGSYETDTGARSNTTNTYAKPGTVSVGVRITNTKGKTSSATATLVVTPEPPPGPVGVSINAASLYTRTTQVTLDLVWPNYATQMLISNDGGFTNATTLPVAAHQPWKLASSGPERLPKTVYVRFLGPTVGNDTAQDDIILDQTPPTVTTAALAGPTRIGRRKTYTIRVTAKDTTSGVRWLQLATDRAHPSANIRYTPTLRLTTATAPRWIRAIDRAGNASRWRQLVKIGSRKA
jgi:hypothetical protein